MKVFSGKNLCGDIIITLPQGINWDVYEQELAKAKDGDIMNFKIPSLPIRTKVGDKCFLCYKGQIIGYMLICGLVRTGFNCTTTGKRFDGNFVQRSGEFFKLNKPIPYSGFQGYRYFDIDKLTQYK